jgi:hypothetical protein
MQTNSIESQIQKIQAKLKSWGLNVSLSQNPKLISWVDWAANPTLSDGDIEEICNVIQEDIESNKVLKSELVSAGFQKLN